MIIIDKLCYRSKLRYVSAAEKLLYAVSSLMICVLTRSYAAALIVFIANGILTVGKGKIPLSCYVRLLMIPIVFLIVGTGAVFLNLSKVPMDAFAVPVGEIYITASRESAFWAVNLCITALAAVTCLYFLSLNTTMTDILGALRKMHMPRLLIELMMLIYRFVFILLHTASAIMTAQEARLGNRDYRTQLRAFGKMLTALFFISLRKANALYDAMEEKNSSYSAAKTAYESGQISWQAAQVQKANGMLSNIQYMQQELAWLQAQSGYKCADLALQQALQNYKWAVAGVSVSADTQ